jgi:hypothetical protein
VDWILDLLTQIGITSNHNAIADHTLQIAVANTKSSPARSVFNSHFLVTDINSGDSSAFRVQVFPVLRTALSIPLSQKLKSKS